MKKKNDWLAKLTVNPFDHDFMKKNLLNTYSYKYKIFVKKKFEISDYKNKMKQYYICRTKIQQLKIDVFPILLRNNLEIYLCIIDFYFI